MASQVFQGFLVFAAAQTFRMFRSTLRAAGMDEHMLCQPELTSLS